MEAISASHTHTHTHTHTHSRTRGVGGQGGERGGRGYAQYMCVCVCMDAFSSGFSVETVNVRSARVLRQLAKKKDLHLILIIATAVVGVSDIFLSNLFQLCSKHIRILSKIKFRKRN